MNQFTKKSIKGLLITVWSYLFLHIPVIAASEKLPLWISAPKTIDCECLFVGFQGAQFARAKLGEWKPKAFLRIAKNDKIYYSLASVTKDDHTVSIDLVLWNASTNAKNNLVWQWILPKEVSQVVVTAEAEGEIAIEYPETGETRLIIIQPMIDAAAAKQKFVISRSAPLWNWQLFDW
jgi:hypothetical protein